MMRARCRGGPRFLAAAFRHRELPPESFPRRTGHRVMREAGRDVGVHTCVAAFALRTRARFCVPAANNARCPPAEYPDTAIRAGSIPSLAALARVQRMDDFTSSICAGHFATPDSRYCAAMLTCSRGRSAPAAARPEAVLVAAGKAAAVEVNHRHPFVVGTGRLVDIEVQVGVAALAVDDVLFDVGGRRAAPAGACAAQRAQSGNASVAPRLPRNSRRDKSWLGIVVSSDEESGLHFGHQDDSPSLSQDDLAYVFARFHQPVCSSGITRAETSDRRPA